MNALQKILATIEGIGSAASILIPPGTVLAGTAKLLSMLVSIAQAANTAHIQIAGKPIDLTLLDPIDPNA